MPDKNDHTKKPKKLLERPDAKPSMFVNDISRLFMHRVRRECERSGISHGHHKLLMELFFNEGSTQLQLVQSTHLTAPTVSVALGKMESEGLVRRESDIKDMRQVKVYLTDKGREKVDQVRSIFRGADADMVKGIPQEELDAMTAAMRKILKNLLEEEDK